MIGGTPPIRACAGTLTGASEKAAEGCCAPQVWKQRRHARYPGSEAAAVAAGNEVGITGARKCAVPLCSAHLCAGLICGNMENDLVAGMWMLSWGSRGRRFKSGRPDAGQRLVPGFSCQLLAAMGAHVRSHPVRRPIGLACPAVQAC